VRQVLGAKTNAPLLNKMGQWRALAAAEKSSRADSQWARRVTCEGSVGEFTRRTHVASRKTHLLYYVYIHASTLVNVKPRTGSSMSRRNRRQSRPSSRRMRCVLNIKNNVEKAREFIQKFAAKRTYRMPCVTKSVMRTSVLRVVFTRRREAARTNAWKDDARTAEILRSNQGAENDGEDASDKRIIIEQRRSSAMPAQYSTQNVTISSHFHHSFGRIRRFCHDFIILNRPFA